MRAKDIGFSHLSSCGFKREIYILDFGERSLTQSLCSFKVGWTIAAVNDINEKKLIQKRGK